MSQGGAPRPGALRAAPGAPQGAAPPLRASLGRLVGPSLGREVDNLRSVINIFSGLAQYSPDEGLVVFVNDPDFSNFQKRLGDELVERVEGVIHFF